MYSMENVNDHEIDLDIVLLNKKNLSSRPQICMRIRLRNFKPHFSETNDKIYKTYF